MTDMIKELYYGNVLPSEEKISDPRYNELINELVQLQTILVEKIPNDHKEFFESLSETYEKISSIESFYNFSSGFKLGAKMMLNVFYEN